SARFVPGARRIVHCAGPAESVQRSWTPSAAASELNARQDLRTEDVTAARELDGDAEAPSGEQPQVPEEAVAAEDARMDRVVVLRRALDVRVGDLGLDVEGADAEMAAERRGDHEALVAEGDLV